MANFVLILASLIVVIAILLAYGDYEEYRNLILAWVPFLSFSNKSSGPFTGQLFTKEDLAKFAGKDGASVYLAILGEVFDVSSGRKHYGEGGGYHFFTGTVSTGLTFNVCNTRIFDVV